MSLFVLCHEFVQSHGFLFGEILVDVVWVLSLTHKKY